VIYLYIYICKYVIFLENKITIDIIKELSEQMISELIPAIGPRVIFLSYWRKLKNENPLRSIENENISPKRNVSLE